MEKVIDREYKRGNKSFLLLFVGTEFLAIENLTDEQRDDANYLREVHSGETLEEVKRSVDTFGGFYEEV